jgi:uncharacterized membrane protein YgcG
MSHRTFIWAAAALFGIVATATIAWSASQIAGQRIGLSSEPLSVASGLVPADRHARQTIVIRRREPVRPKSRHPKRAPATTHSTPAASAAASSSTAGPSYTAPSSTAPSASASASGSAQSNSNSSAPQQTTAAPAQAPQSFSSSSSQSSSSGSGSHDGSGDGGHSGGGGSHRDD